MNEWGKLRWIVSDRKNTADFLDLTLKIENGKVVTRTFQKTMNLYLYIPPISAHPTSCFKGLIVGNFLRFRKQNTDENFSTLIKNFANHLLARGHSLTAIKNHFKKAAISIDQKGTQQKLQQPTPAQQQNLPDATIANRSLYLHWEYHPNGIQRKTLRELYQDTLEACNPFRKGMIVAMSRPKNLRDLLTRTTLQEPEGERASDYYAKIMSSAAHQRTNTSIPHPAPISQWHVYDALSHTPTYTTHASNKASQQQPRVPRPT
jgi:hypothetical protein